MKIMLKDVCNLAGIELPENFNNDEEIGFISCGSYRIRPGCAYFVREYTESGELPSDTFVKNAIERAYERGAKYIFHNRDVEVSSEAEKICIKVPNSTELYKEVCKNLSENRQAKTIAFTGSVGKTTTKEMLTFVAKEKYKTKFSVENSNGFMSISRYIQEISNDVEVYLQEVGAFYPGLVADSSYILQPDACIVTNIGTPHIDLYGSVENIAKDKLMIARNMKEGGVAFLNYDDEVLRNMEHSYPVIWFSVDNREADFSVDNIEFSDGYMEFDIIGKCEPTHITLHTYGIHNIVNAVASFAAGLWMGLSESEIARGLSKFKAEGLRQNLCTIGGYRLYVDCYNSAPISVIGMLETAMRISIDEGNKRIAVLGDIPRMGDASAQVHIDVAREIAGLGIDLYLCYGEYMAYMAEELEKLGCKVYHTNDRPQLNAWVEEYSNVGDLILFKAGHPSHLAKTIDQVFGTTFHITDADVILETGKNIATDYFNAQVVDGVVNIKKFVPRKIVVPAFIDSVPVFKIGADAFSRCSNMEEIVIEEGIQNIGFAAFYICKDLKKITIPSTCKVIERSAFNYCISLDNVVLPEGVTTLERRAFYDCHSLKRIVIPNSVKTIGEEAFKNCKELTIQCREGSYAEEYAKKENIPVELLK